MFFRKKKQPDYFAIMPLEILVLIAQYLTDNELINLAAYSLLNKKTYAASSMVAAKLPNQGENSAQALMKKQQHQHRYQYELDQITYDVKKYLKIFSEFGFSDHLIKEIAGMQNVDHRYMYDAAMVLFGDYCKHLVFYLQSMEKAARFFSGNWNHTHNNAVKRVMMKHDPSGLAEKYNGSLNSLLEDLKFELLNEGNLLKKHGELTKRIKFIQEASGLNVIDLMVFCDESKFIALQEDTFHIKIYKYGNYHVIVQEC